MDDKALVELAMKARMFSYAPYSKFKVGAALLAKNGEVYTGCNIESASYTPTNCAERTAFFKAVSEGVTEFEAIAIVGGADEVPVDPCYPCGVCRQVMAEFCEDGFRILMGHSGGKNDYEVKTLDELLPHRFGPSDLK